MLLCRFLSCLTRDKWDNLWQTFNDILIEIVSSAHLCRCWIRPSYWVILRTVSCLPPIYTPIHPLFVIFDCHPSSCSPISTWRWFLYSSTMIRLNEANQSQTYKHGCFSSSSNGCYISRPMTEFQNPVYWSILPGSCWWTLWFRSHLLILLSWFHKHHLKLFSRRVPEESWCSKFLCWSDHCNAKNSHPMRVVISILSRATFVF